MDVIIKIKPFSIFQNVYIRTPTKIETDQIELNKLNNFLFSLPEDAKVKMIGNKQYISHYIKKYREEEATKYQNRRLNILNEEEK